MIDLEQYRIAVGCYYYKLPSSGTSRTKGYFILYDILEIGIQCNIICVAISLLLLMCGDIEINPGPKVMKICPKCKTSVAKRQSICKCGFIFSRKGRPVGTTEVAGFKASKGRPVGTTHSDGYIVGTGLPIGTTINPGFNASSGRPIGAKFPDLR